MRLIGSNQTEPLHGVQSTREIERAAAESLPAHALMARAGKAVAQLTQALAPHAQNLWIACGPGNNGGDGLMAAALLQRETKRLGLSRRIHLTLAGDPKRLPADATHALGAALTSGLNIEESCPLDFDFAIDALLGIGATRQPTGTLDTQLAIIRHSQAPVLAVDLPSGLEADTGVLLGQAAALPGPRHTLSLLTLKPGLFTAQGRDASGDVWFDRLGVEPTPSLRPTALLNAASRTTLNLPLLHATHKGSHGEVLVIGGQGMGYGDSAMIGAAVLAARAAIRTGAGRVYLWLLEQSERSPAFDSAQPELMCRTSASALQGDLLERSAVVCGCGGGEAVVPLLTAVLARARRLVLDADALNAIAADAQLQRLLIQRQALGWMTVITPHPLEAARLLGCTVAEVMADRLAACTQLSEKFKVIAVLKGSGTIITAPDEIASINGSGNGALATAGTGDVLAGMLGATLARSPSKNHPLTSVAQTVFHHGRLADHWVERHGAQPLTADQLTK
jgi:ADP-dependent NAD(P)H-hydrate dehydratase / NAD(P)H-hydrate epimerase